MLIVKDKVKPIATFLFLLLCGCSYSSRDTSLQLENTSAWKVENHIESSNFSTDCESGKVIVALSPLLESDGGVYFFLVVPIGSANVLDRTYKPVDIYVQYPSEHTECSLSDVIAIVDGAHFAPDVAGGAKDNAATCKYSFKPPIGKSGSWALRFKGLRACSIPDLNLIYETKGKIKYEKMQG